MAKTPRVELRGTLSNFNAVRPSGPGGFAMLAEAAGTIADVIRPAALAEAREQGANAVYRDENGVLRVDERSLLGGEMAAEHNRVAFAAYLAQQRVDLRDTMTELSLKHQDDPAAFREAALAYRKLSAINAPPALRADVNLSIADEASRVFNGLRLRLFDKNLGTAERQLKVTRLNLGQDLIDLLSESRGAETPEFDAKLAEILDTTRLLVTMGVESEADIELQRRIALDKAQAAWQARLETDVGEALEIIRSGGIAAGEDGLLKDVEGTELQEPLETAIAARTLAPSFARMSPAQQADALADLKARPLTPEMSRALKELETINEATIKAVDKDGLQAAQGAGYDIGEVILEDPRTMAARLQAARALAEVGFNPDGRLFTDEDRTALAEQIEAAIPENKSVFVANLIEGFGDVASRAIRELGVKGVFTHAGQLLADGMDPRLTGTMFAGEALLAAGGAPKPDKATRLEGDPKVLGALAEAVPDNVFDEIVPGAKGAALAYYAARAGATGEDDLDDLWIEAWHVALGRMNGTGGLREVNGFDTFLDPDVNPDAAEDALVGAFGRLEIDVSVDIVDIIPDFPSAAELKISPVERDRRMILAREELREEAVAAAVKRFNKFMSLPNISISGGAPMNGRDAVLFSDLGNVRIIPVQRDVYELHVERTGGLFVALTDSQADPDAGGSRNYRFSLRGLIAARP